jgi:hypothetical protein
MGLQEEKRRRGYEEARALDQRRLQDKDEELAHYRSDTEQDIERYKRELGGKEREIEEFKNRIEHIE